MLTVFIRKTKAIMKCETFIYVLRDLTEDADLLYSHCFKRVLSFCV